MAPFPMCVFPFSSPSGTQSVIRWDGDAWHEAVVVIPWQLLGFYLGPDGELYLAEVAGTNGEGIRLYKAVQAPDDQTPSLEVVIDADIGLPTHLDDFDSNIERPHIVWVNQQAALVGVGSYWYYAPDYVSAGVVYGVSSLGTNSLAAAAGWSVPLGLLNAAVEFEDGSFASCAWGIPS